ncbi:MAG TPA: LCP family protein [Candidatus Saccharimonadales bacterium]|nr:LCP family protein [Candidatus Saccharimonadales bacterium]
MAKQNHASKRPLRPIKGQAQANSQSTNFPAVGMTLNTYRSERTNYGDLQRSNYSGQRSDKAKRAFHGITLKRIVVSLFVLVLLIGGWYGWKIGYNLHKLFGGNPFSILTSTKLKGEDSGRVNILLAGYSNDDPGHSGAQLTDSIMILSIDTKNHTAFMLSVPRDLYVKYDTYGCAAGDQGKINAVYECGQWQHFSESGYPNGGMGQLEKVISTDFGIPIDYYALIDYTAIRDAVDAVGGIDINIQSSDPRGIYDPDIDYATHPNTLLVPKLSNGWHHFDGEQALDLARARGDAYGSYGVTSDFDRTQYQREMLIALKSKAASAAVISNPVRFTQLFDSIGNNVQTDLNLSDVHRLYDVTNGINPSSIKSIGLNNVNGQDLLTSYNSNAGSALVPAAGIYDYSEIQNVIQRLTSNNPVVKEAAKVVVLNGTYSYGLASQQQKILESHYINVTQVGNANETRTTTLIIDNSNGKMPSTKQQLENLYGNNVTSINPYSGYSADFIVVLGSDQLSAQ